MRLHRYDHDAVCAIAKLHNEQVTKLRDDYEGCLADHRRLVRELDVMMNGDGAAKQASLVDLVEQFPAWKAERNQLVADEILSAMQDAWGDGLSWRYIKEAGQAASAHMEQR